MYKFVFVVLILCGIFQAQAVDLPINCGDSGTEYLIGDLNHDCYVNMEDVAIFMESWLHCTDPMDSNCDVYW